MKKIYFLLLFIPSFAWAAVFPGNGGTGFGGAVGNGNLVITDNGTVVSFQMNASGSFNGNNLVIYIDNLQGGGYASTSGFTDTQDGGRTAISGFNSGNPSRTTINFPSGFRPNKAISVDYGFVGLFDLSNPANFSYINSGNLVVTGNTLSFSFNKSDLGIAGAVNFNFFASLISPSAYRSNEAIGALLTDPAPGGDAPNYGFNGTINPPSFALYPAGVLAVSGIGLTGQNHGAQTFLQWTTINETGLNSFSVQQSTDGINWMDVAYATGLNNGTGNTYNQTVKNLPGTYNYFRVKVISGNGITSFSNIFTVKPNLRDDIVLINTLAQNELVLQFNTDYNGRIFLRIVDGSGRTLKAIETGSGAGGTIHLNVTGIQNGMYFLNVRTDAGAAKTFQFFKQ